MAPVAAPATALALLALVLLPNTLGFIVPDRSRREASAPLQAQAEEEVPAEELEGNYQDYEEDVVPTPDDEAIKECWGMGGMMPSATGGGGGMDYGALRFMRMGQLQSGRAKAKGKGKGKGNKRGGQLMRGR